MSTAQQAKARRRQMRNGYAHLGNALKRPIYGIKSVESQRKRLADQIAKERAMQQRKSQRKA